MDNAAVVIRCDDSLPPLPPLVHKNGFLRMLLVLLLLTEDDDDDDDEPEEAWAC